MHIENETRWRTEDLQAITDEVAGKIIKFQSRKSVILFRNGGDKDCFATSYNHWDTPVDEAIVRIRSPNSKIGSGSPMEELAKKVGNGVDRMTSDTNIRILAAVIKHAIRGETFYSWNLPLRLRPKVPYGRAPDADLDLEAFAFVDKLPLRSTKRVIRTPGLIQKKLGVAEAELDNLTRRYRKQASKIEKVINDLKDKHRRSLQG